MLKMSGKTQEVPLEYFIQVFKEWRKENKNPENLEEMDGFIKNNFPKWYSDVLKE